MRQNYKNYFLSLYVCLLSSVPGLLAAQTYPNKPVKVIVTNPAGGSSDIMARLIAQKLADLWKQSVLVENRAGAAGSIGMVFVASQPADGYTFLFGAQGSTIVSPLLSKVPYDMAKDFTPVALVATGPSILMINAALPYRQVSELIAAARAQPSSINFGSGGVGTAAHLGAEMFNSFASIQTTHVPYKGGIAAINDLVAGQIQFQFTDAAPVMSYIKSGKLRPLAVTTAKRFELLPDVPTFVESGLQNFVAVNSWGIFLPSGASKEVVHELSNSIRKVMSDPEIIRRFSEMGFEAQRSTPDEYKTFLASENARYSKLIRENKLRGE